MNVKRMICVFSLAVLSCSQAYADAYAIFDLGSDEAGYGAVYGITDAGDVAIPTACAGSSICYTVFQPFAASYVTQGIPSLDYDNGTPCTPVSGAVFGKCNNGFEAYELVLLPAYPDLFGLFDGPDPYTDSLHSQAGFIFVNANGDIAWTDPNLEENYEAYDLTTRQTPEPSALALMTTGLVSLLYVRRREPKFVTGV
jgi:PEP-CTERM motif